VKTLSVAERSRWWLLLAKVLTKIVGVLVLVPRNELKPHMETHLGLTGVQPP